MNKKLKFTAFAIVGLGILSTVISCKSSSQYQELAVKNFDSNQYLGKWFEVARMDFKFEKDMKNVTAQYSLKDNGMIDVLNKGFNMKKGEWKEANGKAKFAKSKDIGALKVSFFGPFYSEYNVVMMDPDYKVALVFGESTKYLWILSREKTISTETKNKLVKFAKEKGYNTDELVWTIQD